MHRSNSFGFLFFIPHYLTVSLSLVFASSLAGNMNLMLSPHFLMTRRCPGSVADSQQYRMCMCVFMCVWAHQFTVKCSVVCIWQSANTYSSHYRCKRQSEKERERERRRAHQAVSVSAWLCPQTGGWGDSVNPERLFNPSVSSLFYHFRLISRLLPFFFSINVPST